MEIKSPYKVKEVLSQQILPEYILRVELIDDSEFGGDGLEMVCCYTPETGEWIGDDKDAEFLCMELGLKNIQKISKSPGSPCQIGFSEKEQKWYGWSHRAIFGFGIGSKCKKGSGGYIPVDESDSIADGLRFWDDEYYLNVRAGEIEEVNGDRGVWITWDYNDTVPNKKLRGTSSSVFWTFPEVYGRGEWTAKTLEDAKQMAAEFANGVS
jgi:hypothetical protein